MFVLKYVDPNNSTQFLNGDVPTDITPQIGAQVIIYNQAYNIDSWEEGPDDPTVLHVRISKDEPWQRPATQSRVV